MKKIIFRESILSTFLALAMLISVQPAQSAVTSLTLIIAGGGMSISAPTTGSFGSVASPSTATVTLGSVTVTDLRGAAAGGAWTATAVASQLIQTDLTTMSAALFSYSPGIPVKTGTVTLTEYDATSLLTPFTIVGASAITGNNTATWTPLITVAVPSGLTSGTYTGTITHSVS